MASDYRPGGLIRFDFPEDTGMGATPQRLRGKSGTAPPPRPILLSAQRGIMAGGLAAGRVLEPVGPLLGSRFKRWRPIVDLRVHSGPEEQPAQNAFLSGPYPGR